MCWGSSPLARGAPSVRVIEAVPPGLIPAGAGRTGDSAQLAADIRAHPRWRGAHSQSRGRGCSRRGSSPLARGAQHPRRGRHGFVGLIPAGAGRTGGGGYHLGGNGLIPAGAGRTRSVSRGSSGSGAHPRWRGAHSQKYFSISACQGSSPLARGALTAIRRAGNDRGLIPAGAGRTERCSGCVRGDRAHPRWRGAHRAGQCAFFAILGSSPLARGARVCSFHRSIRFWAHPRWRGAHSI